MDLSAQPDETVRQIEVHRFVLMFLEVLWRCLTEQETSSVALPVVTV